MQSTIRNYKKVFKITIALITVLVLSLLVGCTKFQDKSTEEQQIKEQKVIFKKFYDTNDKSIEKLKEDALARGKKVYVNTEIEGNLVLVIETKGEINDIKINEIDLEKFEKVDYDINSYVEKYSDLNYKNLEDITVNNDTCLIIRVQEPETIPMYYLTFKDELDKTKYYLVNYKCDNNGEEITTDEVNINTQPNNKEAIVLIDNGVGEGDDIRIIVNNEVIAHVSITNEIFEYKDYYITIEKTYIEDSYESTYDNLIVVDKYSGEKMSYKLEKVKENFGVSINNFDKDKGILEIDTGATTYSFNIESRSIVEIKE